MTIRTITVTGARGGQGTSTVAAAIALFAASHSRTVLVSEDVPSMAALLGVPAAHAADPEAQITPTLRLASRPSTEDEVLVIDTGTSPAGSGEGHGVEHYAVVRGPCYLSLASLVRNSGPLPDGVILVAELGRSLTATDVTEVLGVPVVATVAVHPSVARSIDAGLLSARLDRLHQLKPLRLLASTCPDTKPMPTTTAASRHRAPVPACQTLSASSTRHTDLPFPPSGNGWVPRAPVKKSFRGCRISASRCA